MSLINTNTQLNTMNSNPALENMREDSEDVEEAVKAIDGAVETLRMNLTGGEG